MANEQQTLEIAFEDEILNVNFEISNVKVRESPMNKDYRNFFSKFKKLKEIENLGKRLVTQKFLHLLERQLILNVCF